MGMFNWWTNWGGPCVLRGECNSRLTWKITLGDDVDTFAHGNFNHVNDPTEVRS